MAFADNLQQLPTIDHLAGLELLDAQQQVVGRLLNQPGQAGSVRVYAALAQRHGAIDADAAREGLALYAEHTADAIAFPGKHPNIDRLLALADSGAVLQVRALPAAT
jgi:hypothetical protein